MQDSRLVSRIVVLFFFGFVCVINSRQTAAGDEVEAETQVLNDPQKAIEAAHQKGRYVLLYFYEEGDKKSAEMRKAIEEAGEKLAQKADFVDVNIEDETHKALLEKYGVHRAPLLLVVAPGGTVTGHFHEPSQIEHLHSAFVSKATIEIIRGLQEQKVVFVAIQNDKSKQAQESMQTLKKVANILRKTTAVVKIDPRNEEEKELLSKLSADPQSNVATIIAVSPLGVVGDKLVGKITAKELFAEFQKILVSKSGCGSMGGGKSTCE